MMLSGASLHPRSVYHGWPLHFLKNVSALCSQPEDVPVFVHKNIQRLKSSHIDPKTLCAIINKYEDSLKGISRNRVRPSTSPPLTFPLPFNTSIFKTVPRALRQFLFL